jgi:UPF0176 protein
MRRRERVRAKSRWWTASAGGLVVLLAAGCSGGGAPSDGASASIGSTVTVTEGTRTSTRSVTVTSTSAAAAGQPPPATEEPAPVAAACPYLSDDEVADINGQRTGVTTIVDVPPHPICTFSRPDGAWLATVRIVAAATPEAAVAAVDQHVPVDQSSPADDPAGWSGGSMPTDDGSIYAVSKGPVAVIAQANQPQSIKGRQLATAAIGNLGL